MLPRGGKLLITAIPKRKRPFPSRNHSSLLGRKMENFQIDKFEADLNEITDPNPKTKWWNEAVFRTTLNTILYLEIALVGFCIIIPTGFDANGFLLGQKIMIIPVLVVGFKVAMNEKAYKTKKVLDKRIDEQSEEIKGLNKTIAEKDNEIYKLRVQLDDKCKTADALRDACGEE